MLTLKKTFTSDISQKEFPLIDKVSGKSISRSILKLIQKDYPEFNTDKYISFNELNYYRKKYILDAVTKQMGDVTNLEKTVLDSITDKTTISGKVDIGEEEVKLTFGQKITDKVASFGGSWTFIISFGILIVFWVLINVLFLTSKAFDPYPFILLNLILSCLAALQAPIIMMSQNRKDEKDRDRSKKDYMINLKSELEIRGLHEKIDNLIIHQQQELMEIQSVQIDMMADILKKIEKTNIE